MNTLIDELEIKIEYYESVEEDPLKRNDKVSDENSKQNICSETSEGMDLETGSIKNYSQNLEKTSCDLILDNNINTWYKNIDNSGKYLCRFCELSYSTVQTLRHHTKRKHSGIASDLKDDIINNKRNKKIKCHICNLKFNDIEGLQDHINNLHQKEYLDNYCHICKAVFENDNNMKDHLFNKHNISKSNNLHLCYTCGYRTFKLSHFTQHKKTHSFEKILQCKQCKYSTNYMPNMKTHERIHSQLKPYVCKYKGCEYAACTKSALQSHLLKHNPEMNMLYCDKCTYKTVYRQTLKKHIEGHSRNTVKLK